MKKFSEWLRHVSETINDAQRIVAGAAHAVRRGRGIIEELTMFSQTAQSSFVRYAQRLAAESGLALQVTESGSVVFRALRPYDRYPVSMYEEGGKLVLFSISDAVWASPPNAVYVLVERLNKACEHVTFSVHKLRSGHYRLLCQTFVRNPAAFTGRGLSAAVEEIVCSLASADDVAHEHGLV